MKLFSAYMLLIFTCSYSFSQSFFREIDVQDRNDFCVALEEDSGSYFALINSFDHAQTDYTRNSRSIILHLDSMGKTLDSVYLFHPDSNIYWSTLKLLSDNELILCGELYSNSDSSRMIIKKFDDELQSISSKILGSDGHSYLTPNITEFQDRLIFLGGRRASATIFCTNKELDSLYSHIIPNDNPPLSTGNTISVKLNDSTLIFQSYADQLDSTLGQSSLWSLNIYSKSLKRLAYLNSNAQFIPISRNIFGLIDEIWNYADDTIINGNKEYHRDLRIRTFDIQSATFLTDSCICSYNATEEIISNNSAVCHNTDQSFVLFNERSLIINTPEYYSNVGLLSFDTLGHATNRILIPWSSPLSGNSVSGNGKQVIIGGTKNFVFNTQSLNLSSAFILGMSRDFSDIPSALSFKEAFSTADLTLYPNPANGSFSINKPEKFSIRSVEILSMQEEVLLKTNTLQDIPLPDLAGIYLVRITTIQGNIVIRKMLNLGH